MDRPGSGDTAATPSSPTAIPGTGRRSWRATGLAPTARTVAELRHHVRGLLASWGADGLTWEAELLLTEVAGNAVRHARTPFDVTLTADHATLRCEVTDADPRIPQIDHQPPDAEGGRGLRLVDELATQWGVRVDNTGKTVWFDLTTAGR